MDLPIHSEYNFNTNEKFNLKMEKKLNTEEVTVVELIMCVCERQTERERE